MREIGQSDWMIYTEVDRRYYPSYLLTLKQIDNSPCSSLKIIFHLSVHSQPQTEILSLHFNSAYDLHLARKEEFGLYFSRD